METAMVIAEGECQTVRLPKGFHLSTPTVGVRQDGETIVLEPLKPGGWAEGFFDSIHMADPAFVRPAQGWLAGHFSSPLSKFKPQDIFTS